MRGRWIGPGLPPTNTGERRSSGLSSRSAAKKKATKSAWIIGRDGRGNAGADRSKRRAFCTLWVTYAKTKPDSARSGNL